MSNSFPKFLYSLGPCLNCCSTDSWANKRWIYTFPTCIFCVSERKKPDWNRTLISRHISINSDKGVVIVFINLYTLQDKHIHFHMAVILQYVLLRIYSHIYFGLIIVLCNCKHDATSLLRRDSRLCISSFLSLNWEDKFKWSVNHHFLSPLLFKFDLSCCYYKRLSQNK